MSRRNVFRKQTKFRTPGTVPVPPAVYAYPYPLVVCRALSLSLSLAGYYESADAMCLSLLCCCLGPGACGLCCGLGSKAKSSVTTRLLYVLFLFFSVVVSAIMLSPHVQAGLAKVVGRPATLVLEIVRLPSLVVRLCVVHACVLNYYRMIILRLFGGKSAKQTERKKYLGRRWE